MQIAWLSFLTPQTISWLVEVRILGGVDRFVEIVWADPYNHNQTWTALWLGHCQTCGTHPSHEFNGSIGVLQIASILWGMVYAPCLPCFKMVGWHEFRVSSAPVCRHCGCGSVVKVYMLCLFKRDFKFLKQLFETVVWNSCCMYMCSKMQ